MNIKEYFKKERKRKPKTYAKIEKRWDFKMISPVHDFCIDILKHVNPKLLKRLKKDEWVIDAPEIEGKLWKLLEKTRRISLLEDKQE